MNTEGIDLYPVQELSSVANREEFGIPDTPLGNLVSSFRLAWGWVEGELQACIIHESVNYPGFRPATRKEATR